MSRTEYDTRNLMRSSCRNCNIQLKEFKRLIENQQSELSTIKMSELKQQKTCNEITRILDNSQKTLGSVMEQLTAYQEAFAKISEQLNTHQQIMELFYEEYQSLKKRQGKEQLMNYIRLRDSMLKDIDDYEKHNMTNTNGYRLLKIYADQLTEILEDQSVEIISVKQGSAFEPEIQKPLERVPAYLPEQNNRIIKVYNCGYRWNGVMLKKADVSVWVYR